MNAGGFQFKLSEMPHRKCNFTHFGANVVQDDYVGFNTGSGEKLSYSQAEPGQLLGCSLVSLHFRWCILQSPVQSDAAPRDYLLLIHVKCYCPPELPTCVGPRSARPSPRVPGRRRLAFKVQEKGACAAESRKDEEEEGEDCFILNSKI